jgi:hypothetical protein
MIRKTRNKRKIVWYHNFYESLMEKMTTTHALGLTNEKLNCSSRSILSSIINTTPLQEILPSLNIKNIKISLGGRIPSLSLDSRLWR